MHPSSSKKRRLNNSQTATLHQFFPVKDATTRKTKNAVTSLKSNKPALTLDRTKGNRKTPLPDAEIIVVDSDDSDDDRDHPSLAKADNTSSDVEVVSESFSVNTVTKNGGKSAASVKDLISPGNITNHDCSDRDDYCLFGKPSLLLSSKSSNTLEDTEASDQLASGWGVPSLLVPAASKVAEAHAGPASCQSGPSCSTSFVADFEGAIVSTKSPLLKIEYGNDFCTAEDAWGMGDDEFTPESPDSEDQEDIDDEEVDDAIYSSVQTGVKLNGKASSCPFCGKRLTGLSDRVRVSIVMRRSVLYLFSLLNAAGRRRTRQRMRRLAFIHTPEAFNHAVLWEKYTRTDRQK